MLSLLFHLVALYLSQLAVLDVITDQIGHKKFLKQFNQFMHLKEQDFNKVKSERTGPALNIKITNNSRRCNILCCNVSNVAQVILDVDFTLALYCPKFPKDAKGNIFFLTRKKFFSSCENLFSFNYYII